MSSSSPIENRHPMARLPPNLVELFAQALRSYQLADVTFRVLCSVSSRPTTSSSSSSSVATSATPSAKDGREALSPLPPRKQLKTLIVLDSSFNPPTLAHQRMALSALRDPRYASGNKGGEESRVLLLLAINNADKAPQPATFPQRLAMMYVFAGELLRLLSSGVSNGDGEGGRDGDVNKETGVTVVDIAVTTEPYFHAKSAAMASSDFYSACTEQALEQMYLTGFDTLIRIFNPKYYPDDSMKSSLDPLFARARLRVTIRADAEWGDAASQRQYLKDLRGSEGKSVGMGGRAEWADRVEMVEGRSEEEDAVVSSSKVREAVKKEDWDALGRLVSGNVKDWIREQGLYGENR